MAIPFCPQPKPRPRKLAKQDRTAKRVSFDEKESAKARVRANGQCEVYVRGEGRCRRRDCQTHHMLKGRGVRAHGESAFMIRKQRTCAICHSDIEAHVLTLVRQGRIPRWTDQYRRAK